MCSLHNQYLNGGTNMKKYILLLITVSFLFSCNGKQKDNAKDSKNNVKNKTKIVKNITITAHNLALIAITPRPKVDL